MRILAGLGMLVVLSGGAVAQDISGGADHPLIPRYDGSEIVRYESIAFDEYRLMTAPAAESGGRQANAAATMPLEGEITRITYRAPKERSVLEVFRNYEQALTAAGFETQFACDREDCGGRRFNHAMAEGDLYGLFGEYQAEQRYLAARKRQAEGDAYVSLYAVLNRAGGGPNKDRTMVQLDVIVIASMEERMVVVEAPQMQQDLAADGRVAVYGIHFDFDSDALRAESKPQLEEIARLLTESPELQVLIVGHTDGEGAYDYNLDLSQRRARSVVAALVNEYGIASGRLTPVGVGMAAPVATNRSDEGRARNRRVELVER